MLLPAYVLEALEQLRRHGYESYLVGGCVRDMLMEQQPHDYDIATNALPGQAEEVFSGFTTIATGKQHGTVTVMLENHPVEITTYRTDGEYSDNRRPDNVEFTSSLHEDLSRRDFTVNAMAYYPGEGVIDQFGGHGDLKNKIIRCVGDPEQRFKEDALRILRGARFCSVLGFNMEPKTKQALFECKALLRNVSAERVQQELNRLLCGQNAASVLREYAGIIQVVIPETAAWEDNKVLEHTLSSLENTLPDLTLRMAVLLHGLQRGQGDSTEPAGQILKRLRYSNRFKKQVIDLIRYGGVKIDNDPSSVKRWLTRLGEHGFRRLIQFKKALDDSRGAAKYDRLEQILEEIISRGECWRISQLAINGKDLRQTGIPQGKVIGALLNVLLDAVIDGKTPNNREKLLELAQKEYDKIK